MDRRGRRSLQSLDIALWLTVSLQFAVASKERCPKVFLNLVGTGVPDGPRETKVNRKETANDAGLPSFRSRKGDAQKNKFFTHH